MHTPAQMIASNVPAAAAEMSQQTQKYSEISQVVIYICTRTREPPTQTQLYPHRDAHAWTHTSTRAKTRGIPSQFGMTRNRI